MLCIINPTSAGGRTQREWPQVRAALARRGLSVMEHITKQPGEATAIARRAFASGRDCVVAVGGDGTLNEVVGGYFDEVGGAINPNAAIGLWPSGTGSDFGRSIGITRRDDAEAALAAREQSVIDVARVELRDARQQPIQRYLVNVAGFGLGGAVVARVNAWRGVWPAFVGGRLRYSLAALSALKEYKTVNVALRLDQAPATRFRSGFFAVANGQFAGGGMLLAPAAQVNDGLLDVVLTAEATRLDILRELPRMQRGEHLRHPKVSTARAQTVEINSDEPLAVDIDGEFAGFTPARVTLIPSAVRMIVAGGR